MQSFIVLPLVIAAWELWRQGAALKLRWPFLLLAPWGYLQYRLCGRYRIRHGGGGPGLERPPERLVVSGPYAYTRNPMYLGHLICLLGVTLSFGSLLGALVTAARAIWFHRRVLADEARLARQFGDAYTRYRERVKRWIPGIV